MSPVSSALLRFSDLNFACQSLCLSEQRDLVGAMYKILYCSKLWSNDSRQIANSRIAVLPLPVGAERTRLSLDLYIVLKHLDCTALSNGNGKTDRQRSGNSCKETSRIPWTVGGA